MSVFDRGWRRTVRKGASGRLGPGRIRLAGPASQTAFAWPAGFRAAVSFSFDDARPSQIRCGIPLMEQLGVAATFFVLPQAAAEDRRAWAGVVERGHEIGNHTLNHPCCGRVGWSHGNALQSLSLAGIREELLVASARIRKLFGIEPWVFAYPCGQAFVGQGTGTQSYVPLVAELFGVGRTFNDQWANAPAHCDLAQVACINSDGMSFEAMRPRLELALHDGGWLVLGGHEVGETGDLETTAVETLEAVVQWCRERPMWIDTVGAIGRYIESAITGYEERGEPFRAAE